MARFALFYRDADGVDDGHEKYTELMGSDSVMYLDGRWGLRRARAEIIAHVGKLSTVKPDITGYRICNGEISRPTFIDRKVERLPGR